MKTGVIRRIDELGRIVIPKEIRRSLRIKEGESLEILVDNEVIGFLGEVHPTLSKKEAYVFELSIDKLLTKKVRIIKFKEMPKYPSITKDLAFVMKKDVESKKVMDIIKKTGGRILTNIDVFDLYVGENVASDEKSIAYKLTFQAPDRTLTDNEVLEVFNNIIKAVEEKSSAKLRK